MFKLENIEAARGLRHKLRTADDQLATLADPFIGLWQLSSQDDKGKNINHASDEMLVRLSEHIIPIWRIELTRYRADLARQLTDMGVEVPPANPAHIRPAPTQECETFLHRAASEDDLDEAARIVQDALGVTYGDAAGHFFSDVEGHWSALAFGSRLALIKRYASFELKMADAEITPALVTPPPPPFEF